MKYKKIPVEIEAVQWTGANVKEIIDFMQISPEDYFKYFVAYEGGVRLQIHTLEGIHQARCNDYIIKGVKGEFYPCKPDIFKMTYDPVE